ncbi:hypothetical protein GCM10025876_34390 [Demequina litorisediminis]|uniref:Phosphoenolpyruvate-protein phosphotransferase n=1 Tax=Demequina litorisediminis TaxID=1849022 RepID=A0ABQ6IHG2_9MICO|nr:hypothetical protein GCM10025876_34390 [Demequina litorisediminis]
MSGDIRTGVGVSAGTVAGPVVQVAPPVQAPADEPTPTDSGAAVDAVLGAFAAVATDLDERAAVADDHAKPILKATALIARDKQLAKEAGKQVGAGKGPATAIAAAVETYAAQFEALGGYFAERVTDLRDVGSRAIAAVLGVPMPGVPALTGPSVIVASDLAPAETAALDRSKVVAIVTEAGGRTSHTAILAAQMGIPAVVQVPGATSIPAGTVVAVDGDSGEVTVDPDMALVEAQRERRERRAAALAGVSGPGRTSDGHPVALLANIGGVDDAVAAGAQDLEGVGLFRTEFVYLSASTMPTVEEQAEVYRAVLAPFDGRRVVVRTLDAGADKPLAFANLGEEENPALGRRGLRLCQEKPEPDRLATLGAGAGRARHRRRRQGHGAHGRDGRGGGMVRLPCARGGPALGRRDDRGARGGAPCPSRARRGRLRLARHQRFGAVHDGRRPYGGRAVGPPRPVAAGSARHGRRRVCRRRRDRQAGGRVRRICR